MPSSLAHWHLGAAARGVLRRDLERVAAGTVPPRSVDQRAAVMLLDILEAYETTAVEHKRLRDALEQIAAAPCMYALLGEPETCEASCPGCRARAALVLKTPEEAAKPAKNPSPNRPENESVPDVDSGTPVTATEP